jgi:pimeloyl-ACP methyl ester carboxylesterase
MRRVENLREYGAPPFGVAVVHGGPGAAGEMAPVARELARRRGVLEPLQTARSLEGQIEELRAVLEEAADLPVTLIGFSSGAWLSYLVAATHPPLAKKLVLIGSGPYEQKYAPGILETRLSRLNDEERREAESLLEVWDDPDAEGRDSAFARVGALFSRADAYDPLVRESEELDVVDPEAGIFQSVWRDGARLRKSGELLKRGRLIGCPVVAIHGAYDPHPARGVEKPLAAVLKDFRFILLEKCGHKPWIERQAREEFFRILEEELR